MKLRLLTILLLLTFSTTNFSDAMKRGSAEQKATRDARAAARNLKRSRGGSGGGDDDKTTPTSIAAASLVATADCAICQDTLEADQEIQALTCTHSFHIDCIDSWLTNNITCPICRVIEPTVAATDSISSSTDRSSRSNKYRRRYFYLPPHKQFLMAIDYQDQALAFEFFRKFSDILTHFQYQNGMTALHYAARSGYVELTNVMIAAGANINAQNSPTLMTPLHLAAAFGHMKCVTILLATPGINPRLQAIDGRTAADCTENPEIQAAIQAKIDALAAVGHAAAGDID